MKKSNNLEDILISKKNLVDWLRKISQSNSEFKKKTKKSNNIIDSKILIEKKKIKQ